MQALESWYSTKQLEEGPILFMSPVLRAFLFVLILLGCSRVLDLVSLVRLAL